PTATAIATLRARVRADGSWTGGQALCGCISRNSLLASARRGVPLQHAQRTQRVPAAGLAGAAFHFEVHRAGVRVLEAPAPVAVALLLPQLDGFGHAHVGFDASPAQVV